VDADLTFFAGIAKARRRQKGFSMVEMLMAAFIMSIGLLGLAMLQTMSIRNASGSRMQTLAIGIGQNILETIDAEARQQRAFRTLAPASSTPTLSSYFTASPVTERYSIYRTPVNASSSDHLERVAVFSTTTSGSADATGTSATSGSIYTFNVVVIFQDAGGSGGTAIYRTMTFRRKVTL